MAADSAPDQPVVTADWMAAESVSAAVVEAAARAAGRSPTEIDSLYEVVDPDALDGVFAGASDGVTGPLPVVEFVYNGLLVRVRGDGHVGLFGRE